MNGELDLDALVALPPGRRRGRPATFTPDVAKARHAETVRRLNAARALALKALTRLHPNDFRALCEQARAKINAERGPLPGDEL